MTSDIPGTYADKHSAYIGNLEKVVEILIGTIVWFIYALLYFIFTLPLLIWVIYLDKTGRSREREELADRFTAKCARMLVKVTGSSVKVTGEENIPAGGPVLYVCNHQGYFDGLIIHGFIGRPKSFVLMIEARRLPFAAAWMKYMGCLFIDRRDIKQSLEIINRGIEVLKKGHSLVIFPEGVRSKGNTPGDFKRGSFRLAVKAQVPIVPVTVKGSYRILEANRFRIKPAVVECIISAPVQTAGMTREEERELPDRIKGIITGNL